LEINQGYSYGVAWTLWGKTTTGSGYLPTWHSDWLPNNRNSLLHSTVHTSYCDTLQTPGHIDLPWIAQCTNIPTHL